MPDLTGPAPPAPAPLPPAPTPAPPRAAAFAAPPPPQQPFAPWPAPLSHPRPQLEQGDGTRPSLRRPTQGRVVAGVAAGVAAHLGLPVRGVRLAFVVGSVVTGGAGVVAYVLLWALTPQESIDPQPAARPGRVSEQAVAQAARRAAADAGRRVSGWERFALSRERLLSLMLGTALVCVAVGGLLARGGVDLHGEIWLPVLVLLVGAGVALRQLDASERSRWLTPTGGRTGVGLLRLAGGVVLAVVGILLLVARGTSASDLVPIAVASLAVLLGVGIVVAPWGLRLWRDLERERALRVRELERSEIAAHLHDSVLQTLALIQRAPGNAAEVARLARAQERELRDYLYAGAPAGAQTLQVALREVVAEVEDGFGVPVDLVIVGDRPSDDRTRALVQALREALLNAVRHGDPPVSVYVETSDEGVSAFVRDRGAGFDVDAVPTDRLGVRESIVGRMQRHGGRGQVLRPAAGGTEVRLVLPAETGSATREPMEED